MSDPDRLAERLVEIRVRYPGLWPEMVAEVVQAVLSTMSGDLSAQETSLLAEVETLGRIIACAKAEIAALRVDDITDKHVAADYFPQAIDNTVKFQGLMNFS